MSSAAWCEANGIKPATFYCRLRKIQQLYVDSLEQTSIALVKSVEPPAVVEPIFVELAPAPSSKTVSTSSGVASILCGSTRIVGLASYVKMQLQLDSFDKDTLFLFCGRKATKIKGLVWEGDGFLFLYIRFLSLLSPKKSHSFCIKQRIFTT